MNELIRGFFYHYTSIEKLTLILNSQNIRFTRADLVNDLEEINIIDKPEIKKSAFISCWTSQNNESIPMWNLYGGISKGVRIKLRYPIFEGASVAYNVENHHCNIMNLKNISNFIKRDGDHEWVKYLFGPIKVNYAKNVAVYVIGNNNSLIVEKIGTQKLEHWKFENESRFLALANHEWNSSTKQFELKQEPYYSKTKDNYFDIRIDKNIFNKMEVTLGPSCQYPEQIIVESLIEKFTTNGKVKLSELKEKIRL
ncbi:hypothetical protein [Desulfobacula sp.]|uniref:hypothetical protein n=1 Tax=Desulfobacula sp. TaxID=2593537 RepID=UPI0025C2D389|nr:hypothetical protein [Desulfobacula sp.]MBC2703438.1 hypothetical protein [Desulfobacula sp.]